MKVLEISPEIDAHLAKLIDAALKHAGLSIHASAKAVIDAIKEESKE